MYKKRIRIEFPTEANPLIIPICRFHDTNIAKKRVYVHTGIVTFITTDLQKNIKKMLAISKVFLGNLS